MVEAGSIKTLSLGELEQTIEKYPWFALARREYFMRLVGIDKGSMAEAARAVGLFVPSRAKLFKDASAPEVIPVPEPAVAAGAEQASRRYVVVGGDYFTKEDFEELERSGSSYDDFQMGPVTGAAVMPAAGEDYEPQVVEDSGARRSYNLNSIWTETLAGIFEQQGYYDRAIEVYQKLILLYPEKSAYFAALIDKIETNNNNN